MPQERRFRHRRQRLAPLEYTGFLWPALFVCLYFQDPAPAGAIAGAALIVAGCWIATRGKLPAPGQTAA